MLVEGKILRIIFCKMDHFEAVSMVSSGVGL